MRTPFMISEEIVNIKWAFIFFSYVRQKIWIMKLMKSCWNSKQNLEETSFIVSIFISFVSIIIMNEKFTIFTKLVMTVIYFITFVPLFFLKYVYCVNKKRQASRLNKHFSYVILTKIRWTVNLAVIFFSSLHIQMPVHSSEFLVFVLVIMLTPRLFNVTVIQTN